MLLSLADHSCSHWLTKDLWEYNVDNKLQGKSILSVEESLAVISCDLAPHRFFVQHHYCKIPGLWQFGKCNVSADYKKKNSSGNKDVKCRWKM